MTGITPHSPQRPRIPHVTGPPGLARRKKTQPLSRRVTFIVSWNKSTIPNTLFGNGQVHLCKARN